LKIAANIFNSFLCPSALSDSEEKSEINCKITAATRYAEVGLKDKNLLFWLMSLGDSVIAD